jgi:medium-chain acyl-[acyl-carrier-protein] hydrolase
MVEGRSGGSWVLQFRRKTGPRLRLFCFPYAGGGAAVYRGWAEQVQPEVEVCSVRLPGREARLAEPPFTRAADLAQALAGALEPLLDVPFAFFGHSMGALAAFELARELRRRGGPLPARLLVSGARAPGRPDREPPVRELPDTEFVAEVRRRYDGIPGAVLDNPELVQLLLPCLRADFTLVETYRPVDEPPLACPISCYGGLDDHHVSREDLEAWRGQTSSAFTLRMFPGDHFFLHSSESSLRRAICEELPGAWAENRTNAAAG